MTETAAYGSSTSTVYGFGCFIEQVGCEEPSDHLNMVDGEVCQERISAHDAVRRTRRASKPCARDPITARCVLGTSARGSKHGRRAKQHRTKRRMRLVRSQLRRLGSRRARHQGVAWESRSVERRGLGRAMEERRPRDTEEESRAGDLPWEQRRELRELRGAPRA